MAYQVKINNFEGPFDLLFHLIEKAEVDIYDIPISEITNQYLEYIYMMESLDLEAASEFIVMAATLIQIKSKMLLPKEVNPLDELAADIDPRIELVEKLIEYKKYKEVSNLLKDKEELFINTFYKNAEIIDDIDEDEILLNITLQDIINAFNDIVKRHTVSSDKRSDLEQRVLREEFTVDDKIQNIKSIIYSRKRVGFSELFKDTTGRVEIIITFLALLELIRLREVKIFQSQIFGEIIIEDMLA